MSGESPNKFTFDAEKHIYYMNNNPIPSCTQILSATGIAPDWRKVDPIILANKRALGSALHKCLHYLQENDLDPESIDDSVKPYLKAYELFVKDSAFKPIAVEVRRWKVLNGLPFGMTLDAVGMINGAPWLIDFKTTEGQPHASWGIQLAAYELGLEALAAPPFCYRRVSLQLLANGQYWRTQWTNPSDHDEWRWALALVWKRIQRGEKPWEKVA